MKESNYQTYPTNLRLNYYSPKLYYLIQNIRKKSPQPIIRRKLHMRILTNNPSTMLINRRLHFLDGRLNLGSHIMMFTSKRRLKKQIYKRMRQNLPRKIVVQSFIKKRQIFNSPITIFQRQPTLILSNNNPLLMKNRTRPKKTPKSAVYKL